LPAVEGYVFDRKTLKPLQNASVVLTTDIDGSGAQFSIGVRTDANGFYTITVSAPNLALSRMLTAECTTRRGIASSRSSVYGVLQRTVYRRDLYVTLPRGMRSCS
jgi:hypothetical protein